MFTLLPLLFAGLAIVPETIVLPEHETRAARPLLENASLRAMLQALDAQPDQLLTIGHAGGQQGSERAEQLRAVLVALGLPSTRIALAPQSLDEPVLILSLSPVRPR